MRRKYYLLVFVGTIALIGLAMTDSSAQYLCGDANSDEIVNVSDAVYMINYVFIFGSPAPDPLCTGDANLDSDVNVSDAVYLINYVFVFGSPPPVPNCCDICPPTVTDYDGNVYQTLLIGDQCWMMKNLEVTHYRNGDPIPNVIDAGAWADLTTGAYCEYDNNVDNVAVYGRLYNRFAVADSRNVAPEGWHVPTDDDWQILADFLGGNEVAGGKMKEAGTEHWNPPNTGATNESGFTALPAGSRFPLGGYGSIGNYTLFWSLTMNFIWSLAYNSSELPHANANATAGLSVRCVKDPID